MLEYAKLILDKVSFDSHLFEKEFKKSIPYLMPNEIEELFHWVKMNYTEYAESINSIYDMFSKS